MAEVNINSPILSANDQQARFNRQRFNEAGVVVFNLISSPGAGKTTLLEKTIASINGRLRLAVVEGDLHTAKDAKRVAACGVPAVQIETKGGCHLDAAQVSAVLPEFDLAGLELLIIENVGNLVCPAEFDLGEDFKVAMLSVPEGDDKPEKYPQTFSRADVLIINKMDMMPLVDFDVEHVQRVCQSLNPRQQIFKLSCRTGEGLEAWVKWLLSRVKA